jgi:DNA-binding CsgD family transcriptional regulator
MIQTVARTGWPWADPSTVVPVLREALSQDDFLRLYEALSSDSGDETLERLPVPTLVMATRDEERPTGGEPEAKRIAALIPDARLVLFDDVYGGFGGPEDDVPAALVAIQRLLLETSKQKAALGDHGQISMEDPSNSETSEVPARRGSTLLSPREVEVLRLVASGKTSREIGEMLVISIRTVERHIANIYLKTGTHGRAQLTAYAIANGIV